MGKSNRISLEFDLSTLIKRVETLDELIVPFHERDTEDVIKEMPMARMVLMICS
jgi:uncharacterized FlaG/YvyC family protein